MKIFCVIVCAMTMVIGKLLTKRWVNLLTIFSGLYFGITFFASLRLFGMYDSSDSVYILIMIGVFSFGLGYFVRCLIRQKRSVSLVIASRTKEFDSDKYVIREWVLKLGCMILIIFTFNLLLGFVKLLLKGYSFYIIRNIYFGQGDIESSFSKSGIDVFLYLPFMHALLHTASLGLFIKIINNKQKVYICIIFGMTLLYCISTGGRNMLFSIAIEVIVLYAVLKKTKMSSNLYNEFGIKEHIIKLWANKKIRNRLIMGVSILGGGVFYLTFKRSLQTANEGQPFYFTIYKYFCGCIPYTDYYLNKFSTADYTYGNIALLSFVRPFTQVLKSFFGISFPASYERAAGLVSSFYEVIRVSDQFRMNGFILVFFYFYYDFGFFSVILYSFIFGMVTCSIEKKVIYNPNLKTFEIYLFLLYLIVFSFTRWYLASLEIIIELYIIQFLLLKKQRKGQNT
ncbi:oligosaccharide repeat unit polymerase [Hungatella hathewayi]|uniref:oligosaccharide repeat unit polymerase n=1 Tax=Hungatella hathewayi TaxID=154046 RepID=UPI0035651BCE